MAKLALFFSARSSLQLEKTFFQHPRLASPLVAVRGKGLGANAKFGSFQWTPAVHALTYLIVSTAADYASGIENDYVLQGEAGSPAASLDYALSKQPQWLIDVFGSDSRGTALARLLLHRSNPERKRPGPVSISLNTSALPVASIELYLNQQLLTSFDEIDACRKMLAAELATAGEEQLTAGPGFITGREATPRAAAGTGLSSFERVLATVTQNEAAANLVDTNVFARSAVARSIHAIRSNRFFTQVAGRGASALDSLPSIDSSGDRLGVIHQEAGIRAALESHGEIRCAVTPCQAATLAILWLIRNRREMPLVVDYRYLYTSELVALIKQRKLDPPPDLCVLSVPATAQLLNMGRRGGYVPLFVMPKMRHDIVVPARSRETRINAGRYFFLNDTPGSSAFYFSSLLTNGAVTESSVEQERAEPDEASLFLKDGGEDVRAILGFPTNMFNRLFNSCRFLNVSDSSIGAMECFLFAREELANDQNFTRALRLVILNAWLELREDKRLIDATVDSIFQDPSYLSFVKRCVGYHNVATYEKKIAANNGQ